MAEKQESYLKWTWNCTKCAVDWRGVTEAGAVGETPRCWICKSIKFVKVGSAPVYRLINPPNANAGRAYNRLEMSESGLLVPTEDD